MNPAKRLALPQNLAEAAESEGRHQWLTTVLPEIVDQARKWWSLTVGEPRCCAACGSRRCCRGCSPRCIQESAEWPALAEVARAIAPA